MRHEELLYLSGPGLRAALRIAAHWQIPEDDLRRVLDIPNPVRFAHLVRHARALRPVALPGGPMLRISALLGIWRGLTTSFPDRAAQIAWLDAPNAGPVCGGHPPRAQILHGGLGGMLAVADHLRGLANGP